MATANTIRFVNNILRFLLLTVAIIFFLLVCESSGAPYGRRGPGLNPRKTNSRNKIVFPPAHHENPIVRENRRILQSVPSCRNTTFCEEPPYYPDDLINYAVQKDDKFKYSATVEVVADSDTKSRIDLMDEVLICSSVIQIVYPKTAENRDKKWLFVINHENFMQGVRIEACNEESSHILDGTPTGYKSRCKQHYTYRRLATILPDGTIKLDAFRFPAGCRGYLKFEDF